MRRPVLLIRFLPLAVLLVSGALPMPAPAQDILGAIRAERWAEADALAAALPDPLPRKLVRYFRLLTPGAAAGAAELAAFMDENPSWPQPVLLGRRWQEAVASESDDNAVLRHCQRRPAPALQIDVFLIRCAEAADRAGRPTEAAPDARAAWVKGVEHNAESGFLRDWGAVLTFDDHWQRFDRLAWADSGKPSSPASQQIARLDLRDRPVAEARLALRRDDRTAPALVAGLTGRADPAVTLELMKWRRRASQDQAALQLWATDGATAEAAASPERRPAFWDERNLLARRMLRAGDPGAAYRLASAHRQGGEAAIDAEFLAGWIALRRLNQPQTAARHFQTLAGLSPAAITQGRAHYWLGRAEAAQDAAAGVQAAAFPLSPVAAAHYRAAAAWPTTYYGQLAAHALGEDSGTVAARVLALQDPSWSVEAAAAVAAGELAQAATLLAAWGEPGRAKAFLQRSDATAPDPAQRAMAARLAVDLGVPEQAVANARRAGRDGLMLPNAGWPMPVDPPEGAVEPAVALGLIRQESSFSLQAISPSGARGLMQLMPATAASVARRSGEAMNLPALTSDGAYNMRLGTAYLQGLLEQFGTALPLALAGYNAGPGRVQDWIAGYGNPLTGAVGMVDWIELIPFNETRNYVQRVIENVVIYRARRGVVTPHPVARWSE